MSDTQCSLCQTYASKDEILHTTPCNHKFCEGCLINLYDNYIVKKVELSCSYRKGFASDENACGAAIKDEWFQTIDFCGSDKIAAHKKRAMFAIRKVMRITNCPNSSCRIICARESNQKDVRVRCQSKVCRDAKAQDFCFFCSRTWKGNNNSDCGNAGCNGKDPNYATVQGCKTKLFKFSDRGELSIPEARLCPKCKIVIYHVERCKKVICSNCKHPFCFVCLKDASVCPDAHGHYNYCDIAPIQTEQ